MAQGFMLLARAKGPRTVLPQLTTIETCSNVSWMDNLLNIIPPHMELTWAFTLSPYGGFNS